MTTVFKQIIDKKIPADIVYEDDLCMAFRDINPQAPTHILLIPKEEIASLAEVEERHQSLLGHLLVKVHEIAKQQGLKSYRVVINTGEEAGQSVFHLHLHILGGREMGWPPG